MNVLHICGNFIGNKLYIDLFKELGNLDISQTVYVPVRHPSQINQNNFTHPNLEISYDLILKKHHRIFYLKKVYTLRNSITLNYLNCQKYDILHAHTLFSDGGVAYLLHKKFQLPYIISIRNTDINIFFKYFKHLKGFIYQVLLNASKIVFISHAYISKLQSTIPSKLYKEIKHKFIVIPNGVNSDFFIDSKCFSSISPISPIRLITIANLDKNKNTITILKSLKELKKKGYNVTLDIVGDGPMKQDLLNFSNNNDLQDIITFHGRLARNDIINLLDKSTIFILTSLKETFGVAYIEAMVRGLPLIYTRNEGIDGYYPEGEVGYSVNPKNVKEINSAITSILESYTELSFNCYKYSSSFHWAVIAEKYKKIYIDSTSSDIH